MWKKQLVFLKPYWKLVLVIPILIILEVWTFVQLPRLLSEIIDMGIIPMDLEAITGIGTRMIFFAIANGILALIGLFLTAKVAIEVTGDLREAVFKKIQTFTFADLDHFKIGSLITRLTNDTNQIQSMLMMILRMALRAPAIMIASVIMLFKINASLSLILLAALLILSAMIAFLLKEALPLFIESQKKLDNLNSETEESLNAIKTIKAFGREYFEQERFAKINEDLTKILINVAKLMAIIMPIMILTLNGATVAIIWFGSKAIERGAMEVGGLIAFINYSGQILFAFVMISFIFTMILRAQASVKRIAEVLSREPIIKPPLTPKAVEIKNGEIEFDDVDFSFNKTSKNKPQNLALEDISFKINAGQKLGIIGGTGSGKTILVSLIMRLYDVNKGRVLIDGIDVRDYDLNGLRLGIGVVLQDPTLFSGTIKENLGWGKKDASEREMRNFLSIAHAIDFVEKNPEKLNYELSRKATNLSGGQKQRISIARALIRQSKILILDDATSAVDIQTEKEIQAEIKKRESEMTIITVGQRITSIMDSDLILVLNKGRIVGKGDHDQLMEGNKYYQEIFQSQMGEGKS